MKRCPGIELAKKDAHLGVGGEFWKAPAHDARVSSNRQHSELRLRGPRGGMGVNGKRFPPTGKKTKSAHRLEQGFSLLELLVATMLLSVGLLGIARVAVSVINGNLSSERRTTATVLAQDALEQLKTPAAVSNSDSSVTEDYNTIPGYLGFKRVRNVEANSPVPGLQRITVTVFWKEDSRSLTLQTIHTQ